MKLTRYWFDALSPIYETPLYRAVGGAFTASDDREAVRSLLVDAGFSTVEFDSRGAALCFRAKA